jgi:hypothetical protein
LRGTHLGYCELCTTKGVYADTNLFLSKYEALFSPRAKMVKIIFSKSTSKICLDNTLRGIYIPKGFIQKVACLLSNTIPKLSLP